MIKRQCKVTSDILSRVPDLVENLGEAGPESLFQHDETEYVVSDDVAVSYVMKRLSFWDKLHPTRVAHAAINAYEAMLVAVSEEIDSLEKKNK